jgi:3-hydroxyisobutyrate dehydrogenase-like beta-hydroxyacid dehydrogenase
MLDKNRVEYTHAQRGGSMRVGFIGLGRMGLPMSQQLVRAGHDVTVYNRTRAKETSVLQLGARAAESPVDVSRNADVVLACLPSLEATRQVFLGAQGLATNARPGMVLVDHSTIAPALAREIAVAASVQDAAFLDAPVSGGPAGAESAQLTIMVGGDAEAFERVRPLFEILGRNVRHVGGAGANPGDLLPILKTAWGQSAMVERAIEKYASRDFDAGAPLRLFEKDLGLIRDMAAEAGLSLPLVEAAESRLREALAMGLKEEDLVAVLRPYERDSGIVVGG